MPEFLIFPHIYLTLASRNMYCIHELVVKTRQVDSVAQPLVRVLHQNRRTADSIPARGPILLHFLKLLLVWCINV
jgi:hypothetical protein